jgi:hypothetical protein
VFQQARERGNRSAPRLEQAEALSRLFVVGDAGRPVAAAIAGLATSAFATSSKQLTIVQRRAIAALRERLRNHIHADLLHKQSLEPARC